MDIKAVISHIGTIHGIVVSGASVITDLISDTLSSRTAGSLLSLHSVVRHGGLAFVVNPDQAAIVRFRSFIIRHGGASIDKQPGERFRQCHSSCLSIR